jgi:hypothetical protein
MGDSPNNPLRVDFDRHIKLEFRGSTVTSDAALLAYRELDDALGLTSTAASGLYENRAGNNTQHRLLAWLRQSIYSRSPATRNSGAERGIGGVGSGCQNPAIVGVFGEGIVATVPSGG